MARYSNIPANNALTTLLNEPGITIVNHPDNTSLHGMYVPTFPVICPTHRILGKKNDFAPETILDLVDDGEGQRLVTIELDRQRYKCPYCKGDIPYDPEYGQKGCRTTKRLDAYIGRLCLDYSPQKVSEKMKGAVSKGAISRIFSRWSNVCLEEYEQAMLAPEVVGIHCIKAFKNTYFVVSDIENQNILDVFQWDNQNQTSMLLLKLATMRRTKRVVSDIEPAFCMSATGAFARHATISAAAPSLYRMYSEDLTAELDVHCAIKEKNILKDWVSTPLHEECTLQRDKVVKALNLLNSASDEQRMWLSNHERLKDMVIPNWSADQYLPWKADVSKYPEFSRLSSILTFEEAEFDNSFSTPSLQQDYHDLDWQMREVILRCQKCAFDVLRKRLLLSFAPAPIPSAGAQPVYNEMKEHTGVSVKKLYKYLTEYDA